MRSDLRCRTTSTWDQAALTASRLRTISLRWLTKVLPKMNNSTTITINTPIPTFIDLPPSYLTCLGILLLHLLKLALRYPRVEFVSNPLNRIHVGMVQPTQVLRLPAFVSQSQDLLQWRDIK